MTSTLSHLLLQAADAYPDRPAVCSGTGELTYGDLCDRSMRLARALVEHGIEPGDRVVISLPKHMSGYWKLPEATSRVFSTGPDGRRYYATGDLVSRDDAHGLTFLPPYLVPDVVLPVTELPRGSRGKADYSAVLELLDSASRGAAASKPKLARSSVLAQ